MVVTPLPKFFFYANELADLLESDKKDNDRITRQVARVVRHIQDTDLTPLPLANNLQGRLRKFDSQDGISPSILQIVAKLRELTPSSDSPASTLPPEPQPPGLTKEQAFAKLKKEITEKIPSAPSELAPLIHQILDVIPFPLSSSDHQFVCALGILSKESEIADKIAAILSNYTVKPTSSLTSPEGIPNIGGNDCFLISLTQVLLTDFFQEHLIERLPSPLKEVFKETPLNSQKMRRALVEHTNFRNLDRGVNPMIAQQDPTEVLFALIDRVGAPPTPPATNPPARPRTEPEVIIESRREVYERSWSETNNPFVLVRLFISYWFHELFIFIFGDEDELLEDDFSPPGTPTVPPLAPGSLPKNDPLNVHIVRKKTLTPREGVPEALKHHDNFGGATNTMVKEEPHHNLDIPMRKDEHGVYNLQHMLYDYLNGQDSEPGELKIGGTSYFADIKESSSFASTPDFLLLHFKRFFSHKATRSKINDDIEGIDFSITIQQKLIETEVEEKDREYTLESFLCHIGGYGGGHYVAYRKAADGTWYYFNDGADPKPMSAEEVKTKAKRAYLVFYKRKSG